MKTAFRTSFNRDLKAISDKKILLEVEKVIIKIEACENLNSIKNLKKMAGEGGFFRIKVKDYRIGLLLDYHEVTLVRCLQRKDMYKYFPPK